MFDTLRNRNALNGCYSGGLSGIGCGNHEARAHQAWADLQTLQGQIPELKRQIQAFKNGKLQAEYVALEQKQQGLRNERNRLNAEIQQARLKRDAWATNPSQQAQLEGLGVWGLVKKAFTCDHHEESRMEALEKQKPFLAEKSSLEREIKHWNEKLSSASMGTMRKTTQELQRDVDNLKDQLNTINKEIQGHIDNYKKQKEAEAMAKIVGEDAASKENEKNTNTLLIASAVGVGVVGLAVIVKMLSKPKAKEVTA